MGNDHVNEDLLEGLRSVNENLRSKIKKLKEKINSKEKIIESLKERKSRKEKEIKKLERELERARHGESSTSSTSSMHQSQKRQSEDPQAESPSQHKRSQRSSKDQLAAKVGRTFVEWCSNAGAAMVDRHTMFADQLTERLPGAEVERVFREKNAAGVVFTDDAQDAVEYWLVLVEGRRLLLPQPDRSGFREIDKCFEGEGVPPDEMEEIYPARIQSKDEKQVLIEKGYID